MRRTLAAIFVALLWAGACTPGESPRSSQPDPDAALKGGTLRAVLSIEGGGGFTPLFSGGRVPGLLDPHKDFGSNDSWGLLRCCLTRTLLSHNGRSAEEGGAVLHPDLARSLPSVSPDGKTWTFELRRGVHYAPPLEDVEITARDFVRSFHRLLGIPEVESSGWFLFLDIQGAREYSSGKADSISGLETPDAHTLVIHLTRPGGDLGARLALPITTPLPPHPNDPDARFGVAEGLDDYGPFLVSSGPYIVEGADEIDFSQPPARREPARGLDEKLITLVRNPAWDEASDPLNLRPAYPDRIELAVLRSTDAAVAQVEEGAAHVAMHPVRPPQFSERQMREALAPGGALDARFGDFDVVFGIVMNLAVEPLNDLHVRRAINLAIDKQRVIELTGTNETSIATHLTPNAVVDNLLVDYDPYATPGSRGDISAAREEMSRSSYDSDGDGVCDDDACSGLQAIVRPEDLSTARSVRKDLLDIGLDLDLVAPEGDAYFEYYDDPAKKTPMLMGIGWLKLQMSAASFFVDQFYSQSGIGNGVGNGSMIGATPEQLKKWGYNVTKVPNVDARIEACQPLFGAAEFECWSELDQYLMQEVVPWVPYRYGKVTFLTSSELRNFEFDQLIGMPSFDQIAVP